MTVQPIKSNNFSKKEVSATYNLKDKKLIANSQDLDSLNNYAENYFSGDLNRFNFTGKNKGFGFCPQVATFETITAIGLLTLERSPAIITNFLTTGAEFAQAILGSFLKEKEEFVENLMPFFSALAGGVGLFGWYKDVKTGEESNISEKSNLKKLTLTIGSAISSVLMFLSAGEKKTISKLADKKACNTINVTARQDERCCFEWASMIPYIWFSEVKIFKKAIDFILPVTALVDGIGEMFGYKLNPFDLKTFNKKWYLGNKNKTGFREKFFSPIMKNIYGYNPPKVFIENENELKIEVVNNESTEERKDLQTNYKNQKNNDPAETSIESRLQALENSLG